MRVMGSIRSLSPTRSSTPALRAAARGMTLIELMVTISLLGILLAMAAPVFTQWTRNAQVRTVSDALQNGARLAQAEAVRRNRQIVFFLTNTTTCSAASTAVADGRYWALRTVPLVGGEAAETLQCGNLSDVASGINITGPAVICFSSIGRQVANLTPGVGGATCTLAASGISNYTITAASGGNRPLRVTVSLGGQVRQCDIARTLSATNPDGCPA